MASRLSRDLAEVDSASDLIVPDDPGNNRFPCCVVWGPLPCLTWMFPFIGHMGIADSSGKVHDFAGPYTVLVDRFMIGKVRRIFRVDVSMTNGPKAWDEAIAKADQEYSGRMHNLFCNNCHHHTAQALTNFGIRSTQFSVLRSLLFQGEWVDCPSILCIVVPFLAVVGVVVLISLLAS
eukprot:TRINITY_DN2852_c0_g1_i1.p1 TRINITY_DN2852_c0_g1~~TRINITY_DN2852_c0_g1_i1.p1  ORF type:complete len:205 (+),score=16.83 TRINITY_DN2852_c0_g1_i1:83-616(+)